ncbi:MAG: hypothetical protein FJ265_20350 [Planctomycetes bacterium]|nr:hypothetical protein [Planctomycetota bacterium]
MQQDDAEAAESALAELAQRLAAEPRLHAEWQRARRQFFGGEGPASPLLHGAADAAERRFAEWFALERDSETLGAVPIEVPPYAASGPHLEGSLAGVFVVAAASPRGVDATDLQDDTVLELVVPERSLAAGDLLVGRLFAAGPRWVPSSAAAVFRPGRELGEAFRRDVAGLGLDRRLQQIELEHLLLRRDDQARSPTARDPAAGPAAAPLEHLEAELDRLLRAGGSELPADTISDDLAAAGRPGPVLGPLLDELAFDSQVDLDAARAVLLQIWNAHHPGAEADVVATSGPPDESLGERLVRRLDDGLAKRRDVGELFAELERMAGVEPDAEGEDSELADGETPPDPGGDLEPLVQEFLWETGAEQGPAAAPLRAWAALQRNAPVPRLDVEQLTAADLSRLLLHVYLGAAPAQRVAAVRAAHGAAGQFLAWAGGQLESDLSAVARGGGVLLAHLERLAGASLALSTPAAGGRPGVLQVEDVGPRGFGVRDDDGADHWLACAPEAAAALHVGDLVLGALVQRGGGAALAGLVVVLPPDARALME